MEIRPPGSFPKGPSIQQRQGPSSPTSSAANPERAAEQAERDANKRIVAAQKRAEQTERETEDQMNRTRDEFVSRESAESARQEAAIESQKLKGYEALRDLKRAQEQEIRRTRREGERDLATVKNYYDRTVYQVDRTGEQKLNETKKHMTQELEQQRRANAFELEQTRDTHGHQLLELKDSQESKFQEIQQAAHKEYERLRENMSLAQKESETSFQSQYQQHLAEFKKIIDNLNNRASQEIRNVRQDTAKKLAAYSSRQSDPFYKLVDLNAEFYDEGDAYIVTARIPEHEQQHVSVAIKGNNIVISGQRRNEEKLDLGDGRSRGTASYQSFQESFPLAWPVDGKGLRREFDGDTLIVSVPKKNEYAFNQIHTPPKPEKARVERPQFPANLPGIKPNERPDPDDSPKKPTPGSGTLS